MRGRIPWDGGFAFFRRHPDRSLDQDDLSAGTSALHTLLLGLQRELAQPPVLIGYSNGAIAAAAAIAVDERLASATALLRPLSPRPERSFPRLDGHPVLLVSGTDDQRRGSADGPFLAEQLRTAGAQVVAQQLPVGHQLTAEDAAAVRQWLVGVGV